MSKANDGGPAYPQHGWSSNQYVVERMKDQGGMSLRDWFAGQAIAGLMATPNGHRVMLEAAADAWELADAMLKARGFKKSEVAK